MSGRTGFTRVLVVAAAAVVIGLLVRGGHDPGRPGPASASQRPVAGASAPPPPTAEPSEAGTPADGPSTPGRGSSYDPADYAELVRASAARAGVNPQLLMAILYNESYKPHDPALERAWQRLKPDSAFGIANMHRAAFDDTKQGRDFAGRSWEELPDHPDLAVEAAAWYLHDLAEQLPSHWSASYTKDELLAFGYNAGAGNMLAFARGTTPGSLAQSYLDRLRGNWAKAGQAAGSRQ
ncbi:MULTISPECIES: transglycosylase SLT domain-containing protein [Kitasatospora]|uniref:Transglycosylase SLT domain-containing protein n=1 Tax=Kitasatospora cystarginea TaxID=58350 RepID=A0ABN3E376_9ACTN